MSTEGNDANLAVLCKETRGGGERKEQAIDQVSFGHGYYCAPL
jgi:hypothetical protein